MRWFLFLLFLFFNYLQSEAQTRQSSHKLIIETIDAKTKKSVPQAIVKINYEGNNIEERTKDNGILRLTLESKFPNIKEGADLSIEILAKGYFREELSHRIGINPKPLKVALQVETIRVTGLLRDKTNGSFLENVEVSCLSDFRTTTGKDGFFQLDIPLYVIEESQLVFTFQKEDYLDALLEEKLGRNERALFIEQDMEKPGGTVLPHTDDEGRQYTESELLDKRIWLTKNVAVKLPAASWCYDGNDSRCEIYGRLYSWEGAKKACAQLGEGWRLPTEADWKNLAVSYGGYDVLGYEKGQGDAKAAFKNLIEEEFKAPLGGLKLRDRLKFIDLEKSAYYWTGSPDKSDSSRAVYFKISKKGVLKGVKNIAEGLSCRCVKD